MIAVRCEMESALAFATGGMNNCTANYLNGATFVTTSCILSDIGKITRSVQKAAILLGMVAQGLTSCSAPLSLNQPKTATIAYIAIAPRMMH